MSAALICALAAAVVYLAVRWGGARSENAALRTQIEQLKRRISRRDLR
jgi:Tfp pilus assembly protein PilN